MLTRTRTPEEAPAKVESGLGSVVLRDVAKTFPAVRRGAEPVTALRDLSLEARPGEIVAVVGPSGCGKTTLLELVCGLSEPDAGTVDAAPAALMAQRDLLLPWRSATDNAALALNVAGVQRGVARERASALLREFGLAGFEGARPGELSGGMRQRVAFARTLLSGRTVLCLDEPFAALDALTRQEMQDWLAGALLAQPRTVVLVTHDVEEAIVLADRVLVMSPRPGRVVASLDVGVVRPRRRADPALVALRERALRELRA
jgi:ABC-type nitrate/sulfonate/bicarbonate transport system ATPase subunit